MNSIEIYDTGKVVEIPSSWDEMAPAQVRWVFRTFDRCVRRGLSPLDFNVRVLYFLLGIRTTIRGVFRDATGGPVTRRDENVYLLCEQLLGFLFSGETAGLSFKSVSNPLPRTRSGLRRLHGPADLLRDLTFGEFRHASVAVNRFFRTHNVADLDECIAFLYRVRSLHANRAGRRIPYVGQRNAARHVRRAARLPGWQKNLIMMWFSACLDYLQTSRIELDGEEVELQLLFSGDGDSHGISFGWNDLLVEVAKEGTLGNIDRVDEEPLFSVLSIMWHNYKERKRHEKIVKAAKAH